MHTLQQILVLPSLPLRLRKTRYCCAPAIQTSRVVGLTDGTTVAGSKMVSTPSVTVPSDGEISTEFRIHVVLRFTAPSNRHLKHVRTPPSTVSTAPPEILKVSTHPVCELTVEIKTFCKYLRLCELLEFLEHTKLVLFVNHAIEIQPALQQSCNAFAIV